MNPWIDVAGWTLVHFLWEGAAIALLALVALWVLRRSIAAERDTPSPAPRWRDGGGATRHGRRAVTRGRRPSGGPAVLRELPMPGRTRSR